jgi:hypothetical protein
MPDNLISVGALLTAGYHLSLTKTGASIEDDEGTVLFTADYVDKLFVINTTAVIAQSQPATKAGPYVQHIVHPAATIATPPTKGTKDVTINSRDATSANTRSTKQRTHSPSDLKRQQKLKYAHWLQRCALATAAAQAPVPLKGSTAAQKPRSNTASPTRAPATANAAVAVVEPKSRLCTPSASCAPAAAASVAPSPSATQSGPVVADLSSRWITVGRDRRSRSHSPRSDTSSSESYATVASRSSRR